MGKFLKKPAKFQKGFLIIIIFIGMIIRSSFAADQLTVIRRPILNIPVIQEKGGQFEILCSASPSAANWNAKLLSAYLEYDLTILNSYYADNDSLWHLQTSIPSSALSGLYDLAVLADNGAIVDTTRHAVKVISEFKQSYYFVHITDTHFPRRGNEDFNTIPEFQRLTKELKIINPEFIIHTGDLTEEASQEGYFQIAQELLGQLSAPIYVAAGDHDLQIFSTSSLVRNLWEKYFGKIMNFSFNYGSHYFAGMESHGLPTPSFTQEQMAWINDDLAASRSRNDDMRVLFYHFDFSNQLSGDFVDQNFVDGIFYGHVHINREWLLGTRTKNVSTAPTMDGGFGQFQYQGEYRLVKVQGSGIVSMPVLQYNNLSLSYSPVNDGSNPRVRATIVNNNPVNFENGLVKFFVPKRYMPYSVTGGTINYHISASDAVELYFVNTNIAAAGTTTVTIESQNPPSNRSPIIMSVSPKSDTTIVEGQTLAFAVEAWDEDGDPLTYNWMVNGQEIFSGASTFTYTTNNNSAGIYDVKVRVSDGEFYDQWQWQVTVRDLNVAQTIVVHPLQMVGPQDTVTIAWEEIIPTECRFKYGASPGEYNLGSINEIGNQQKVEFIPQQVGLGTPGIYYGIITDSEDNILSPGENYSAEFQIIIEAQTTAEIIAPVGSIQTTTPLFQWYPVAGVPYYHIILSDHPVTISKDENGQTIVQGANIIWQAITPETSIRYGDLDPSGYFNITNGTPPPIMSGFTYNYVVLNNYGNHPAFTSTVQSGVTEFVLDLPSSLDPPTLISPADSSVLTAEVITFQWSPVNGAVNYKISVLEQREERGSTVSYPVWESTTSNTLIELPASAILSNSQYGWKVLALDNQGGGTQSEIFNFTYRISVGTLDIYTLTTEGVALPRAEVQITPVEGSSDIVPIVTDDSGYFQKMMKPGTYQLVAIKENYENTTQTIELPEDIDMGSSAGDLSVYLQLEPSSAFLIGNVISGDGNVALAAATIEATSAGLDVIKTIQTDQDGNFSFGLKPGTWIVKAQKSGYSDSDERTITLGLGETVDIKGSPFVLTPNTGRISGVVKNEVGQAVRGATVRISSLSDTFETISSENGVYLFTVKSGNWRLEARKEGFVSPQPKEVMVAEGGEVIVDLTLTAKANLVSGYVTDGKKFLQGASVKAIPSAGSPVTTTTNTLGQYTLGLSSGTYQIKAEKNGYTSPSEIQVTLTVGETHGGVNFTLVPNESIISGKVIELGGTGLQGVTVTVAGVSALTSDNGYYSLKVGEGTHLVTASKQGYSSEGSKTVTVGVGQTVTGIDFVLSPNAGTIEGQVTAGGLPLYQAKVFFISNLDSFNTETDEMGKYSCSVKPGDWEVTAYKTNYLSSSALFVTVNPGQRITGKNFALIENSGLIEGVVTDGTSPIRNVSVQAIDRENTLNFYSTSTGVNGEFRIKAQAGRDYTLKAEKGGYTSARDSVANLIVGETRNFTLVLSPRPSSIKGKITDKDGNALKDVWVITGNDSVKTNIQGQYSLSLEAGTYQVKAKKKGYLSQSRMITLSLGQELTGVDFILEDNFATLQGNVTYGGTNVSDALVQALNEDNSGGSDRTDGSGFYCILRLVEGKYQIRITKAGYQEVALDTQLVGGTTVNRNFTLTALTGYIRGRIDDGTSGLEGATVIATSVSNSYSAATNSDGYYSIDNLPLGVYRVFAGKAGYTSPPPITEVSTGRTDINFTLMPNQGSISGIVTTGTAGIGAALIVAESPNGNSGQAVSAADGSYSISNLAADTYRVTVTKSGYTPVPTDTTVNLSGGENITLNLIMVSNEITVSGKVTDGLHPLKNIAVEARSTTITNTDVTDSLGNFSIGGLAPNAQYTVKTNIFRQGYEEADTLITVGREDVTGIELVVGIHRSSIVGNVRVAQVNVSAETGTGEKFFTTSGANGDYKIANLKAGQYTVRAAKPEYLITPPAISLTLEVGEEKRADFTLEENFGNISGKVSDTNGAGIKDVLISATNPRGDKGTALSDSSGSYRITHLPAGETYFVTATKGDYVFNPPQQQLLISKGQEVRVDFTRLVTNGIVEGKVLNVNGGTGIAGVTVSLLCKNSGRLFSSSSNSSGNYRFELLPAGEYQLSAQKSGYSSSPHDTTFTITNNEIVHIDFQLIAETGLIKGLVRHIGRGIEEASVKAISSSIFTTTTDSRGFYQFPDLPAGVYLLTVTKEGYPSLSLARVELVQGMELEKHFDFPGGHIQWKITDGVDPLPGVKLEVLTPTNQTIVLTSDNRGIVATDTTLFQGRYLISLAKKNYLSPIADSLAIDLAFDEKKTEEIPLPFYHEPIEIGTSASPIRLEVQIPSGVPTDRYSFVNLFYKGIGQQSYQVLAMNLEGRKFRAEIPAQYRSGTVSYFIRAAYNDRRRWIYQSTISEVRISSKGVLYNLSIVPDEVVVQNRVETELKVIGLDDSAANLRDSIRERGDVLWEITKGDTFSTIIPDPLDRTVAVFLPQMEGEFRIKATVKLDNVTLSETAHLISRNMSLAKIEVEGPVRISNRARTKYSFVAVSADSLHMRIKKLWDILPPSAGEITADGLFIPDSTYFGNAEIRVIDETTGLVGKLMIDLFAIVDSTTDIELQDNTGMSLEIQDGSLAKRHELSLHKRSISNIKKYTSKYRVEGFLYDLFPGGLEFTKQVRLTLPLDRGVKVSKAIIGRWQPVQLQWLPLGGQLNGQGGLSVNLDHLSQYALLVENEPLSIGGLCFLPTPFSPVAGPLRIGYMLSSLQGKAFVTVKVYNMVGDLVRVIQDHQLQFPGKHTEMAIAWDGKTDQGEWARNGRYLIEVTAEDVSGKKREIGTVVLVR